MDGYDRDGGDGDNHGQDVNKAVRDAIATTDIEGVGGRIRFDAAGDRIDAPVSLWQVVGGRMIPLVETPLPTA